MTSTPREITRRQMIQRVGLTALVAGPAVGLLSSCATSGGDSAAPSAAPSAAATSATNPFGVKTDAPLEVVIFKGGYSDEYATQSHEPLYKKEFPQAQIKHQGIQTISQTLTPRFASGDVPDVVNNSGTDMLDGGALIGAGQLLDLTPLFEAPSIDDPSKKVKDTIVPGTVESGFGGDPAKPYTLNYVYTAYGLWYDAKMFEKNGWTPPKTFEEFKTFAEAAKGKNIVPFAYAGKNASYYAYWMILISAAKIGGNEVLLNIDNLADNAWNADAVKQAATAWAEIGKYMDKSYEGLIHTEVQTQQNQGKIALYPSGSWLESEQAKDTPAGFEYAMSPTPSVSASDKMPYEAIRAAAAEGYVVPAKGKNPQGGLEYLRVMLSKEAAKAFTEKTKSLTVVVGATEGMTLSPGLTSVVAAQTAAGQNVVTYSLFETWYKELETELRKQTNALMFGRISADEFCANMQKAADKTKADSSINKQSRSV
ncbi:N-acetylglucosamine/diacetylchitobiose ABC transporter substrate-binding protein [Planotetraspora phitsanulokensis]|uniref:Carbohydrate ABC transporter, N-acetylglucosamine/diacetylchitobiose-binding protein n=1 Tax=Planotetraspora phitsanulokensis TaxID=575192 RepID=A0A8J3U327_9ACTN|nr:N-acetylglucosamine/diacetylchitobiose ABC transporter substrate-binding protein [Planotetraspora phitsanulokensis]GII37688.1 carbohydrate ABC transporter, N-acetylglucosamine/diacetylchitobiose-binding protein [Planotetraspora phitsanulokensis]